ncbi:MAG: rhomboid family intramembrane serine protease [Mariprofundaceae bacterium]
MIPLHDDNPTSIMPLITVTLLVACVLVFLWEVSAGPMGQQRITLSLGLIPAVLLGDARLAPEFAVVGPTATVFTSMFLHGGWMHLIGNVLYLWIFGNNIEDTMGHGRFVAFYLVCGIAAAMGQALTHPDSTIPMVGASGAMSGVLGAYALLYPRARVLVFIPLGFFSRLMHLPALGVLGFWFVLQLIRAC